MQSHLPEKMFAEFLNEPSNLLSLSMTELERNPDAVHRDLKLKTPNMPKIEWIGRTGNGEGKITFPDETNLTGLFKNFRLQEGTITYKSGLKIKGKFRYSDRVMVDIFQSGTITFNDGTYAKVEFENLKIKRVEIYERNNSLLGRMNETDTLIVRPKLSNIVKRFDIMTFSEDSLNVDGEVEPFTYSYFGLYLKKLNEAIPKQSPFFEKFTDLVNITEISKTLSTQEIENFIQQKDPADSILKFEIKAFPGMFVFYVDDFFVPTVGKGSYFLSDFICDVSLIVQNNQLMLILKNRIYTVEKIKTALKKLVDDAFFQKMCASEFHDVDQQLNINEKELQFQNMLNKMVKKYENSQKTIDSNKFEYRQKINHMININNSIQKKNEEMAIFEAEVKNQNRKLEMDNKNLTNELQNFNKDMQACKRQFESDVQQWKRTIANAEAKTRNVENDLEAVKTSSKVKMQALANNIIDLENKLKENTEQINFAKTQNKKIIEEKASLQGLAEKQMKMIQDQTSKNESTLNEVRKNLEETQLKLTQTTSELLIKSESVKKITFEAQELEKKNAKLCQSLVECEKWRKNEEELKIVNFKGHINNGKKEGSCFYQARDFSIEGIFVNDLLNGDGTFLDFKTAKCIKGNSWKNGIFSGNEMLVGAAKYNGPIVNNKMNGRGYFEFMNGFNLEATFEDDQILNEKDIILIDLNDGSELKVKMANDGQTLIGPASKKWTIDFNQGNILKV